MNPNTPPSPVCDCDLCINGESQLCRQSRNASLFGRPAPEPADIATLNERIGALQRLLKELIDQRDRLAEADQPRLFAEAPLIVIDGSTTQLAADKAWRQRVDEDATEPARDYME